MSKKYIEIKYPKIERDDFIIERDNDETTEYIELKKDNILISFVVDDDGIYIDLFDSQDDNKKPRAPKGLAYSYLYQCIKLIKNEFLKYKLKYVSLTAGNISPKHLKFDINKLKSYYRSIGFNFNGDGGSQTIKSFLKIGKTKRKKTFEVEVTTNIILTLFNQCDSKNDLLDIVTLFREDDRIDNHLIDCVLVDHYTK
jgi:hypothetical protein